MDLEAQEKNKNKQKSDDLEIVQSDTYLRKMSIEKLEL